MSALTCTRIAALRSVVIAMPALGQASPTIDARGLIVAPGFIDPHNPAGHLLDSGAAAGRPLRHIPRSESCAR